MKAYKFKLRPSKRIERELDRTLDTCRELYNAGLQERRDAYRVAKKSVGFAEQCRELTQVRAIRPDVAQIHSQVLQDVLRRLDRAFQAFFRRVNDGETPGYPRFKSKPRYSSFTYPQAGFKLEGNKLTLSKIGSLRLHLSREIEGKIKTCTIKKQIDGWFVIFTVEENQSPYFPKTGDGVGVDLNVANFCTLSTGEEIENPRYLKKAERELKRAQREVSRRKRGGANRKKSVKKLAKKHQKVQRQRLDFFHKLSLQLVREFDLTVFEDLMILNLIKNHCLAKAISDVGWGTFLQIHISKAESAGRCVKKVAPHFTSQDCSRCGNRVKKSLGMREHRCIACGLVVSRDHNAALNIAAKGRAQSVADSGALMACDPLGMREVASASEPRILPL